MNREKSIEDVANLNFNSDIEVLNVKREGFTLRRELVHLDQIENSTLVLALFE